MQWLDLSERSDNIIACGDVHGEFEALAEKIAEYGISDATVVVGRGLRFRIRTVALLRPALSGKTARLLGTGECPVVDGTGQPRRPAVFRRGDDRLSLHEDAPRLYGGAYLFAQHPLHRRCGIG